MRLRMAVNHVKRGRPIRYPLGELAVGESMFIAGVTRRQISNATRTWRPRAFLSRALVESGVPGVRVWRVDPSEQARGARQRYPFMMMKVGESVFVPGRHARQLAGHWPRHRPLKFRARTVIADGITGARVWRIA